MFKKSYIFILLIFLSCKSTYICGLLPAEEIEYNKSEILNFKIEKKTEANLSVISGKVYDKVFYNSGNSSPYLEGSNVWVKDVETDSVYGISTNQNGDYMIHIPSAIYDFEAQFIGYNNLKIENIKIDYGMNLKLSVLMGVGNDKTVYIQDSLSTTIRSKKIEE